MRRMRRTRSIIISIRCRTVGQNDGSTISSLQSWENPGSWGQVWEKVVDKAHVGRGASRRDTHSGLCLGWLTIEQDSDSDSVLIPHLPWFPKDENHTLEGLSNKAQRNQWYSWVCLALIFCFALCKILYLKPDKMAHNLCEVWATLVYIVSSRTARAT